MIQVEEISLTIEHVNPFGLGVANLDSCCYFVPFTLPGEKILAKPVIKRKNGTLCELVHVEKPANDRALPQCRHYQICGGCDLQHAAYEAQLKLKQHWVCDLFKSFASTEIRTIIPSPNPYAYRNRITLHNDGKNIGFYRRGSHDIISVTDCPIASLSLNQKLDQIVTNSDSLPEILELRESDSTGFFQINTAVNELLKKIVKEMAGGHKSQRILELYAGSGNLSFVLAKTAREIVAVEGNKDAVALAEKERLLRALKKVRFECGDAFQIAYRLKQNYETFDTIVCDPPRGGLANVLELIPAFHASRIIYISCDPHTLEHDLKFFRQNNFMVKVVQPLDMFPQTHHVELVALLEKK